MNDGKNNTKKDPKTLDHEKVRVAGKAFWNITKHYKLDRKEQEAILGFTSKNRNTVPNWEEKNIIPSDVDKLNRVSMLIGIHKNLRILYPYNRNIVYNWLKTKLKDFDNKTPMEYIMENPLKSYEHLFTVRRYLDIKRTMA